MRVFNLPTGSTASHIHIASKGVSGTGRHRLPNRSRRDRRLHLELPRPRRPAFHARPEIGINTFADALQAIAAGQAYVNIHTTTFPGGEIRGPAFRRRPEYSAVSRCSRATLRRPCATITQWRARTSLLSPRWPYHRDRERVRTLARSTQPRRGDRSRTEPHRRRAIAISCGVSHRCDAGAGRLHRGRDAIQAGRAGRRSPHASRRAAVWAAGGARDAWRQPLAVRRRRGTHLPSAEQLRGCSGVRRHPRATAG